MNVGYENERGGRMTESTGFYLVVTLRWRRLWTNMILCEYGSARSKVSFSEKGILEINILNDTVRHFCLLWMIRSILGDTCFSFHSDDVHLRVLNSIPYILLGSANH